MQFAQSGLIGPLIEGKVSGENQDGESQIKKAKVLAFSNRKVAPAYSSKTAQNTV